METHCIYKITNIQDGKYYVGRTKNFARRKRGHFNDLRKGKHCNPRLQHAFNKWGEGSFRMDAEVTGLTESEAIELEQLCLDEVAGMPRCYNISKSSITAVMFGDDNPMRRPEVAAKFKGDLNPMRRPEVVAKVAAAHRGMKRSDETCRRISETLRNSEAQAKAVADRTGKPRPKVTCPHCGKVGGPGVMHRWHFDNCKHKVD